MGNTVERHWDPEFWPDFLYSGVVDIAWVWPNAKIDDVM